MKLNLKQKENEIVVGFGKRTITINTQDKDKNLEWKTDKINEFLIDLSATIGEDDKIELAIDPLEPEKHSEVFNHIIELFKLFSEVNLTNISK